MYPPHHDRPPDPSDPTAIEQAAAEWILRRERGLTETEEAEFSRWIGEDPHRAATYAALEETLALMQAARQDAAAENTLRSMSPPESPPDEKRRLVRPHVGVWSGIGAIVAIAASMALGLFLWRPAAVSPSVADPAAYRKSFATEVGLQLTHVLPDGSTIRLNTDSRVEVLYSAAMRGVRLVRGEAHFEVAKDPGRPFVVHAGPHRVRAVGTAFLVHLRSDSVEVLVTEGRVKVDPNATAPLSSIAQASPGTAALPPSATAHAAPGFGTSAAHSASVPISGTASASLGAGQKLTLSNTASGTTAPAVIEVAPERVAQILAWREGRLEFAEASLAEIVAEMNRYSRRRLVLDDPKLAEKQFGGTFPIGNQDLLVRLLENNFGIVVERRGDETHLRLAP